MRMTSWDDKHDISSPAREGGPEPKAVLLTGAMVLAALVMLVLLIRAAGTGHRCTV